MANQATHPGLYEERVRALCDLSTRRLHKMIDPATGLFIFRVDRQEDGRLEPAGVSPRYTAMTALGLERAEEFGLSGGPELEPILLALDRVRPRLQNVGDLALVVWAAARRARPVAERALTDLLARQNFARMLGGRAVHSTELAWVVTALAEAQALGLGPERRVRERLKEAFELLLDNRGPSGLLAYARPLPGTEAGGAPGKLQRELGFFDAQVYAIVAALRYHEVSPEARAKETALTIGRLLLEHQGPLGQWAWHYNVRTGNVVDLFPVYSVHQDGMAPMALLPLEAKLGLLASPAVEKGVGWLFGENEIGRPMLDVEKAEIWRSVRRRGPLAKLVYPLKLASLAGVPGRVGLSSSLAQRPLLEVDHEFRPYHLGWCLYAFAELATRVPATLRASASPPLPNGAPPTATEAA